MESRFGIPLFSGSLFPANATVRVSSDLRQLKRFQGHRLAAFAAIALKGRSTDFDDSEAIEPFAYPRAGEASSADIRGADADDKKPPSARLEIPTYSLALVSLLVANIMPAAVLARDATSIGQSAAPARPAGPCDIYAASGAPCVAAHSTTRALYAAYNGPLYQVMRQADGKTRDIGVVQASASPNWDPGGYADAPSQDAFCADTYCWITKLYDQSEKHNDLVRAPRGYFSGPAMGGANNLPLAEMAPITVMGHKVYGLFIAPGMGLRLNDARGTAVDDQAEGQYWVIDGHHYNSGCCFDYGNGEIDSRDDGNGTMETAFYGNTPWWYHGSPPGPWVMTDQENNLVGCVNADKSKLCAGLPTISWRFVTATAKGESHHWTTMGGDAQQGRLATMFDGPRIDLTYDPMRKQGAILLGNGGDNSNGSQGTFYEGAMTSAGTFPSNATDQLVQANIVAAKYDLPAVTLAPASSTAQSQRLQTFTPSASKDMVLTFTNRSAAAARNVTLSISPPQGWNAYLVGGQQRSKTFAQPVAPGVSVAAAFTVTSPQAAFNGDISGKVTWVANGESHSETASMKVRNAAPIKINEFRVSDGSSNSTNSFIELYNASQREIDISGWSLTEHAIEQAIFSSVAIPAGTKLAAGGFYVLGLSNSGLSIPAQPGDATIRVRDITGMKVGDTIRIGTDTELETRKIAKLGSAARTATTLWQPLPDGPVIEIPAGSTNVPVASTSGFAVGEKIALGYGGASTTADRDVERYEIATVTNIGKPGTQAYLSKAAPKGASEIKVTSVENISPGDQIRLDIDSDGHGIEMVTVKSVGSAAKRNSLVADTNPGATSIVIHPVDGGQTKGPSIFAKGDKIEVGMSTNVETVTVAALNTVKVGVRLRISPALAKAHATDENVVFPGTGLKLTAALKFNHAANLPFSVRGTGISFLPASRYAHFSNEPVQPLGTGVVLDRPLNKGHAIEAVVQVAEIRNAGFQGQPDQWFGGPPLSAHAGSIVLRDQDRLVVDSLNYGGLVDPWAAEGYQAASGFEQAGCFAPAPGAPSASKVMVNSSASRYPDGRDSDSNCIDFRIPAASILAANSTSRTTNIKVETIGGFHAGQTVMIGSGNSVETAIVAKVGTPGSTALRQAAAKGATSLEIASRQHFGVGQSITIGSGPHAETTVAVSVRSSGPGATIVAASPMRFAHEVGAQVSGTGITFVSPLTRAHVRGEQITSDLPTPGAPNVYSGAGPRT